MTIFGIGEPASFIFALPIPISTNSWNGFSPTADVSGPRFGPSRQTGLIGSYIAKTRLEISSRRFRTHTRRRFRTCLAGNPSPSRNLVQPRRPLGRAAHRGTPRGVGLELLYGLSQAAFLPQRRVDAMSAP